MKRAEPEHPLKSAAEFAAEYGFHYSLERKEVGPFTIGMSYSRDMIQISIFRAPQGGEPREDGFEAIDLMFSGKLEITRGEDGCIWNWRPLVNSISMHHPNHFGPQRGLVISEMLRLLSQELITVEEIFRKHARPSPRSPSKQAKKEEDKQMSGDDNSGEKGEGEEEEGQSSHFDSLVNYDFGYMP